MDPIILQLYIMLCELYVVYFHSVIGLGGNSDSEDVVGKIYVITAYLQGCLETLIATSQSCIAPPNRPSLEVLLFPLFSGRSIA